MKKVHKLAITSTLAFALVLIGCNDSPEATAEKFIMAYLNYDYDKAESMCYPKENYCSRKVADKHRNYKNQAGNKEYMNKKESKRKEINSLSLKFETRLNETQVGTTADVTISMVKGGEYKDGYSIKLIKQNINGKDIWEVYSFSNKEPAKELWDD